MTIWNEVWQEHMGGAWGWFGASMMFLWMILLVAAIVAFVAWVVRGTRQNAPRGESPRDIIDARFARGEIDTDERDKMLRTLA